MALANTATALKAKLRLNRYVVYVTSAYEHEKKTFYHLSHMVNDHAAPMVV